MDGWTSFAAVTANLRRDHEHFSVLDGEYMFIQHRTDLVNSAHRRIDDRLHRLHRNRAVFASAHHLDHLTGTGSDEIQVDGSSAVLLVVEIDQ